jgi:hypothetical protein
MTMRAFWVAVTLFVASAVVAPARARAAASDDPPETGIGAGQLVIGAATASLMVALPLFANNTPLQSFSYVSLFAGPAAVGGMVCTFGHTSKHYTGGCGWTILGAYLGALAALPASWLGSAGGGHFDNGDEGKDFTSGGAIGFAIGYAIGAAVGATIAWHLTKEERDVWAARFGAPPAPPGVESLRWSELGGRPAPPARAAVAKTVPLLGFAF